MCQRVGVHVWGCDPAVTGGLAEGRVRGMVLPWRGREEGDAAWEDAWEGWDVQLLGGAVDVVVGSGAGPALGWGVEMCAVLIAPPMSAGCGVGQGWAAPPPTTHMPVVCAVSLAAGTMHPHNQSQHTQHTQHLRPHTSAHAPHTPPPLPPPAPRPPSAPRYGMSKFVSGVLGAKFSPTVLLAGGLMSTALINVAFGESMRARGWGWGGSQGPQPVQMFLWG